MTNECVCVLRMSVNVKQQKYGQKLLIASRFVSF